MNNEKMSTRDIIDSRLREAFCPIFLEVLDESEHHRGHAGYRGGDSHFEIRISKFEFLDLSRIAIHQKIYALLADLFSSDVQNSRIHALKITLLDK